MVFVNSKKFACESCIKGHRSSSCHHTDRPLFEVKKKGRPVSQCEKCRELRQSRRVHSKCKCNPTDDSPPRGQPQGTKSRRYIPIVPALPNGLKDVLQASSTSATLPPDSRQRVDSLLNPCNCKSVWKCKCRTPNTPDEPELGLATLARAAAMCCSAEPSIASQSPVIESRDSPRLDEEVQTSKRPASQPVGPGDAPHKRHKGTPSPGPDLPPIFISSSSPMQSSRTLPVFPTMPPMSTIKSLAGSGCTCGLRCACPGCVEHRGSDHASKDRRNCADGCGTCVDHSMGIGLPGHDTASTSSSILDRFFARAAALPAPPTNRKMGVGVDLDPMNVMVYPTAARETLEHGVAFGLVNLPKLECCGGNCKCPNGRCGCGQLCDGCCADHAGEAESESFRLSSVGRQESSVRGITISPPSVPVTRAIRSCCAARIVAPSG